MTEGIAIAVGSILSSAVAFFLIRWMNGTDAQVKETAEKVDKAVAELKTYLEQIKELNANAVRRGDCSTNHNTIMAELGRLRNMCFNLEHEVGEIRNAYISKRNRRNSFFKMGEMQQAAEQEQAEAIAESKSRKSRGRKTKKAEPEAGE